MKIIIVQGMTCLGKTTLCKQLQNDIPNCGYFALDTYKEEMWDKFGFDSAKQREHQSNLAKQLFYSDIYTAIQNKSYDYILIDYTFVNKGWDELMENLKIWNIPTKTIYLKPTDLSEHKKVWENRSRDFTIRHPGHGATHYHDGKGTDYTNNYETKIYNKLPTKGEVLNIDVSFNPYGLNISFNTIKEFIVKATIYF